ncbi:MAG: tetratricopeptide repeat protein [Acidobacteriia bacterium]|nr:tetratricopeptide repeat protein [Terriglobia bacterium]
MRVVLGLWLAMCALGTLKAQDAVQPHLDAARRARNLKQYVDAEREGTAAVQEAERLGSSTEVLHGALADLALTYYNQRKYAEAESLWGRAAEVGEAANIAASAQSWDWNHVGMVRRAQNKTADAVPAFQRALELAENALGPDHPDLANILLSLGYAQLALQKHDQAEASLRRALKIQDRLTGRDRSRTAETMFQLALVLNTQAKYEESEQFFQGSLKIWEAVSGLNDASVARVLTEYGDFLRHRGRSAEAELVLRRALAIDEKALPDHVFLSTILNDLALAVEFQSKYEEAESLFLRALDIAEKRAGSEGVAASRILGNLAALYRGRGRLPEAEKMAFRALALREKTLGKENINIVYELYDLADIYSAEKRYDDAAPLLQRALDIQEKALGSDHPDVTNAFLRLGANLRSRQRIAEAELLYRKPLDIAEKRYGPKDLHTANALIALVSFFESQSRFIDSEPLYRRAQAIREEALASKPAELNLYRTRFAGFLQVKGACREAVEILEKAILVPEENKAYDAQRLFLLGELYRLQGRYAKAERMILKALDTDVSSAPAVSRLSRLALIDSAQQRYTQAQLEVERALALVEKAPDATRAGILAIAADIRRDNRQFVEAGRLYQQALALLESWPVETIALAHLLDEMGVSAMRQNRLVEAEPLFLRARRIFERIVGTESAHTATCLWHLASLYREQKRFSDAEQLFQRSIAVHEKTLGDDVPVLAPVLRDYALMLRMLNRPSESAALEARAKILADSERVQGTPGR